MANIKGIFNFLKDYNDIRNPVTTDISKQMWHYKLSDLPSIDELWSVYNTDNFESLNILEIERPTILPCPPPDKSFIGWINKSWDKLSVKEVKYIESKTSIDKDENGEEVERVEYFTDDKDRLEKYNTWIEKRNQWLESECPKETGLNFYNELFSTYSSFKRESESIELILGDGLINWQTEDRTINHPVLLQKVNLEFNSDKPSFVISCGEIKTELYTPMLRVIDSINQTMLSDIIKEVEEKSFHIADKNNNIGVFKRLINVIDEKGIYVEQKEKSTDYPTITYEPILFLRKRNLGYSEFINKIIEDLDTRDDVVLPEFFQNIIGNYKEKDNKDNIKDIEENWNESGIDEDILLTLPANNEQMKIIKYLDNYGAVLVQGPPGTGKTHTIANLIGHLLSEGNRVLVTSHTEKALRVLKEKVYKKLQSLCISLLSSSSERKEMDATLFAIAEKSTSFDQGGSLKRIHRLEKERKELVNSYKEKKAELIQVRSLQYKDIVYGNTTIKPIDAAKFVNDGKESLDFIPGTTLDDTILLPIDIEELKYLYNTNSLINKDEEEFLYKDLPSMDNILSTSELKKNIEGISTHEGQLKGWTSQLIFKEGTTNDDLIELLNCSNSVTNSIEKMSDFEKHIVNKSINDSLYRTFWEDIFKDFEDLMLDYENYRKMTFYNNYDIPNNLYCVNTLDILYEIIDSGKEIPVTLMIGIVKPKWKMVRDSITIDKKPLEKIQEYKDVTFTISYSLKKEDIIDRINRLIYEIEGQEKIENNEPEERIRILLDRVKYCLNWYEENWIKYSNKLDSYVMNLDEQKIDIQIKTNNPVESIKNVTKNNLFLNINNYYTSLLLDELIQIRECYLNILRKYTNCGNLFKKLLTAVENNDIESYDLYRNELSEVYSKNEINIKRYEILKKIEKYAPEWANAINDRVGIHGNSDLPKDITLAWKWRQLSNQLDRIDSYDPNIIQEEIEKINKMLIDNARKLAYEKAWCNKIINTTAEQTQAIEGWRQTMKQIGKGTGKQAPILREKARQLMPLCQGAIPVWIMPLNSVAENFDPSKNKFDVIIIDEASQADILALSALYLGKKIIIVGDDEQVSPEAVGIKTNEVTALVEQHLQGIPMNHLFNGRTSMYDMAKTSGFKPIMLVEHFRCLPEIIEFSNQLSYNGKIKPLRDSSGVNTERAVIEYRVPAAYRDERKVNLIEAEHIASLVCACIGDESYKGKTIGVISLLGSQQAYEIDRILQTRLEPKEYEDRRIQCGTSAQFQGDERDVIFLSVVDSPKEDGGPLRLVSQDGNNDINRKRYNVAASRAKDQMWVVHSLNPEIDLKPEDIRLRLIKYAMNPTVARDDGLIEKTESDFELKVMRSLLHKGYKVIPQWKVGAYRIDMVVEDGNNRIALECDGERWHTQDDLEHDLKRQAILERLGWKFIRIRGSAFYRNPEKTMEWVYTELENNNINPNYSIEDGDIEEKINNESELINKIKIRANELRMQWNETDKSDESSELENEDEISENYSDKIIAEPELNPEPLFESEDNDTSEK